MAPVGGVRRRLSRCELRVTGGRTPRQVVEVDDDEGTGDGRVDSTVSEVDGVVVDVGVVMMTTSR
jgi:hypothetical protein